MKQFGTVDELYRRLDEVKRPALRAKLEEHREQAMLSRELATVRTDLALPFGIEDLRCGPVRRDALSAFAKRWEVRRLEQVADSLGVADQRGRRARTGAQRRAPRHRRRDAGRGREAGGHAVAACGRRGRRPARPEYLSPPAVQVPPRRPRPQRRCHCHASGAPSFELPGIAPLAAASQAAARAAQGTLDLFGGEARGRRWRPARAAARRGARGARARHPRPRAAAGRRGRRPRSGATRGRGAGGARWHHLLPAARAPAGAELHRRGGARAARAGARRSAVREGRARPQARSPRAARRAASRSRASAFDLHLGSFLCDATRDHSLEALARDVLGRADRCHRAAGARAAACSPGLDALPVEGAALAASRAAACLFPLAAALTRAARVARAVAAVPRTRASADRGAVPHGARRRARSSRTCWPTCRRRPAREIARLERELGELAGRAGESQQRAADREAAVREVQAQARAAHQDRLLHRLRGAGDAGRPSTRSRSCCSNTARSPSSSPPTSTRCRPKRDATDGRVHTTFEQTGAATGRLSSSDPNLQNIPMRTPQGRAIRRAFVAAPGSVLVGADYSQIELRVMAHLSGDPNLIEAFRGGEDVHASTARQDLRRHRGRARSGAARARQDRELRRHVRHGRAQPGAADGHLARAMRRNSSRATSGSTPACARFSTARSRRRARAGWVATLLGRRRYLPQLAQADGLQRSNAERAAINTPIQGSAADLVKLAMLRVDAELARSARGARLLLQVHDELLVECREGESRRGRGAAASARWRTVTP